MRKLVTVLFVLVTLTLSREAFFPQGYFDRAVAGTEQEAVETADIQSEGSGSGIFKLIDRGLKQFYNFSGFKNATPGHIIMIIVGIFFIFLAIKYDYEPLLLIPIGTGIIIGNIPFLQGDDINLQLGI